MPVGDFKFSGVTKDKDCIRSSNVVTGQRESFAVIGILSPTHVIPKIDTGNAGRVSG